MAMSFAQLHPLLVHFPVGLLVSGVVFEFYGLLQKEETALEAGRFNIRFGTTSALVVGSVGLLALLDMEIRESSRQFLGYHLTLATATIAVFGTSLAVMRWFPGRLWSRPLYLVLMIIGLACVLSTGYFGGELVHRFGIATLHPVE